MKPPRYIIILAIIASCEFNPTGENFVEINSTPPNFNFLLSAENEGDTFLIFKDTEFMLEYIRDSNVRIQLVNVYLNDKAMYSGDFRDSFDLNVGDNETGYYPLKVETVFTSGTGSLADLNGLELFQAERSWVVFIENEIPLEWNFKSIEIIDGALKLEWDKYPYRNFKSYQIYNTDNSFIEIGDRDQLSSDLENYVGGYGVVNLGIRTYTTGTLGSPVQLSYPFSRFISIDDSNNGLEIYWSRNKFDKYFKGYNLFFNNELVYSTENINDTVYAGVLFLFDNGLEISLRHNEDNNEQIINQFFRTTTNSIGNDVRIFEWVPNINSYYGYLDNDIVRLDADDLSIKSSTISTNDYIDFSDNGLYSVIGSTNKIFSVNPESFEVLQTIEIDQIIDDFNLFTYSINNRNHLFIHSEGINNQYAVIDLNSNTVLFNNPTNLSASITDISNNSKFIIQDYSVDRTLFEIGSDSIKQLNYTSDVVQFSKFNEDTFWYNSGLELLEISLENFETIKTISLNEEIQQIHQIPSRGLIVLVPFSLKVEVSIIDYETGEFVKKLVFGNSGYFFGKDKIFDIDGNYITY